METCLCKDSSGLFDILILSDADDCNPNPCLNGGICQDIANGHICICLQGFTGPNCETSK